MRKNWRTLWAVLLVVVMSVALTACGSSSSDDGSGGNSSSGSKSDKEIEFWSVFTGPDGDSMSAMVDAYNATNPEYKVIHRPIEANDLYTKLPTLKQTETDIPDLCIVHVERLPLFVEQGILHPLDDYIAANGNIKADNYVPVAWDKSTIDGKHYAVPLDVHSFITYYNKDLLEKYGPNVLDDNAITFDEIKEVGEKAKADNIVGMGLTWMRVNTLGWYAQLGGQLSENGVDPTFNNDKFATVLNSVKELHDMGLTSIDGDDPGQLFQSGQMVFYPEGIWMKNDLLKIDTLNFGMTHFIQYDPAVRGNWTSSHQMVMIENPQMTDERAQGVMAFVEWVGNNSLEWAKAGQVPASLKILDEPEFADMGQSFLLDDMDSLVIHDYKYYGYAVEALDKVVLEVPFGRMTAEEALTQAEKETADRISAGN